MEPSATRTATNLSSLTGLRFAAALAVFVFHLHSQGMLADASAARIFETVAGHGAAGVGFFFILSGFVLTWSARPGTAPTTIWRRRGAKIYPLHLVTWTIALAGLLYASSHPLALPSAVATLTLTQAWFPSESVYFAVNTPAWSLSCEAAFYVAFPFLLVAVRRIREQRLWLWAGTLVAGVLLVPVAALPLSGDAHYWFVHVFPLTRGLEFVLGMLLARLVRAGRWPALGLGWISLLVAAGYGVATQLPVDFAYAVGLFLPFALLIPTAAATDLTGARSFWRSRWCVWLGEISFAFYLVHQIVIRAVDMALGNRTWTVGPAIGVMVAMLAASLAAAWVLHRGVELPMMRLLTARRPAAALTPATGPALRPDTGG